MKAAVLAILLSLVVSPPLTPIPAPDIPAASSITAPLPQTQASGQATADAERHVGHSKVATKSTMMVKSASTIYRTASTKAGKSGTLASRTLVLITSTKGSGWAKVQIDSKSGWIPSSKLTQPATSRYTTTKSIAPRAGIKTGRTIARATKGYTVWGTGKTKSGHVQLQMFGYTGWAPASSLKRVSIANYATKSSTKLRSTAGSGKVLASVPKAYTLGTTTNTKSKSGTWVKVEYRSTTGWLATKDLKAASLNAATGPSASSYSNNEYAAIVGGHIAKWCPRANVRITNNAGQYYAESVPARITLGRKGKSDPYGPDMRALALHECAHLVQFKTYPRGFSKLMDRAEAINPRRDGRGIEHLADCMSDQMGAKRAGSLPSGSTYSTGYKGTCSSTQKAAAKALLAGKKPVGG